jgi:hypothetical protein
MRATRAALLASAAALAGLGIAAPAHATVSSSPLTYNPTTLKVTVTGTFAPNQVVFVQQCRTTETTATFAQTDDCSQATGINPNANGAGSLSAVFDLFAGDEPLLGAWTCATPASCFVRLAPDVATNTTSDIFYPLVAGTVTDPVVPEAPLAVLLPAGGLGILGAAFLLRKRHSSNPV